MTKALPPKRAKADIVRLAPSIFCCALGPRLRGKGARVMCVGRKGHQGNCRATEFGEWTKENPEAWLTSERKVKAAE